MSEPSCGYDERISLLAAGDDHAENDAENDADLVQHLRGCAACRTELASVTRLLGELRALAPVAAALPTRDLADDVRLAVAADLAHRAQRTRRLRTLFFATPALAAAAALVLTLSDARPVPSRPDAPTVIAPTDPSDPDPEFALAFELSGAATGDLDALDGDELALLLAALDDDGDDAFDDDASAPSSPHDLLEALDEPALRALAAQL